MVSAALLLAVAAAACDLDGLPGMHRYNPFVRYPSAPAPAPDARSPRSVPSTPQSETPKKDTPSSDPVQERPRAWESNAGNGPISPRDKATFS